MIGVSCPEFSVTPFHEIFDEMAKRFPLWEIVAEYEHSPEKAAPVIIEKGPSYDMRFQFHAPFSDLNIASVEPSIREPSLVRIEETIRIASELSMERVTLHPGYMSPIAVHAIDKVKELNSIAFKRIGKASSEHGVEVCLENMPPLWITYHEPLAQVISDAQEAGLRVCLDLGHASLAGQLENIEDMLPLLSNIHIHDNDGTKDQHKVPGEGTIDLRSAVDLLKDRYNGNWIYETRSIEEGERGYRIIKDWI